MGPTIIRFFEQFTEDNALYIVMEYGEGGTLADKLKEYCDSGQKVPAD